ncbi:MAG: HD domain-containing protein [Syntrophomonas sp.]|nr:HD domain-containing protein [Syntrophomonas sp.]
MKIIRVSDLHQYIGCKVARNVYIGEGQLYIGNGTELTAKSVEILQSKGDLLPFEYVYVHTPDSEGIQLVEEIISDQLKFKAKKKIKEVFDNVNAASSRNFGEVINSIVDDLIGNRTIIQGINTLLFNKKGDIAAHCLNTAIIASIVAVKLGLPRSNIENMAIGAALHDIGKAKIHPHVLNSQQPADIMATQEHPLLGYQQADKSALSLIAKRIILMHHVWEDFEASWDSTTNTYLSFPKKLNSNTVDARFKDIYISIVQAADVFDNMCTEGISKAEILEYIRDMEYIRFGPGAKALLQNISPYSLGSEVLLSNGMTALVTGHTDIPERPIITFTEGPLKDQTLNLTDKNYLTYQVGEKK